MVAGKYAEPCCPECGSNAGSRVIDSRPFTAGRVRRRRVCMECRGRWTTYEITEGDLADLEADRQTLSRIRRDLRGTLEDLVVAADTDQAVPGS